MGLEVFGTRWALGAGRWALEGLALFGPWLGVSREEGRCAGARWYRPAAWRVDRTMYGRHLGECNSVIARGMILFRIYLPLGVFEFKFGWDDT